MFVFSLEFLQQRTFGPGTVCVLSEFGSGSAVKLSQDRVAVNAELQTAELRFSGLVSVTLCAAGSPLGVAAATRR